MTHITDEIAALAEWTIKELRTKWHEIYGAPPLVCSPDPDPA